MSVFADVLKSLTPSRTNRFRVMLLCFAAATTFWFLNAMNKEHTTTLNYPVEFIYDKDDYVAVEPLPAEVAINVNGVGWNLLRNNLGIKTSPLLIPLENPSEIKSLSAISIPSLISDQISEFQLNYVLTDTLYISLDRRIQRVFHLAVDSLTVPVEQGYRLSSPIRVSPDSVILYGPQTLLESLQDTLYLPLGDELISQTFNQNISVPIPEKVSSADPPIVQVAFNVDEYVQEEILVSLQLVNLSNLDSLTTTAQVRVTYTVERSRADEIGPEDFTIIGDVTEMNQDSTVIPRLTYYPLGLINLRYDSTAIRIEGNE